MTEEDALIAEREELMTQGHYHEQKVQEIHHRLIEILDELGKLGKGK